MARVLDPGPIPYAAMALYGDVDLEHGLRHAGFEPSETAYRLIDIPVALIIDARDMPRPRLGQGLADAIAGGLVLPPIVVIRRGAHWWLIDGVNRTNAHVVLGRARIRAYELLDA